MLPSQSIRGRPSLLPESNFDPGYDAEVLKKAMKGLGTDCKAIIKVLSKRTSEQRQAIARKFKASYGNELENEIKSELSGDFRELVLNLLQSIPLLLAKACQKAIKERGTDERHLIEVFVQARNNEMHAIKAAYKTISDQSLEDDVRAVTSGDFCKILIALLQGDRDENVPANPAQAEIDAKALYEAGEKRIGTDESTFIRIMTQRSLTHLAAISAAYEKLFGKKLIKAVMSETSGYFEDTIVAIVRLAEYGPGLFAEWIHKSLSGLGTRDSDLMRLVLTHVEVDMEDLKVAYQNQYKTSLAADIEADTSSNYKDMLLALIGNS